MNTQQAVESLWKAGYRANAYTLQRGYVVVLDPVIVMSGAERRTEYKRVVLHSTEVAKFLVERS